MHTLLKAIFKFCTYHKIFIYRYVECILSDSLTFSLTIRLYRTRLLTVYTHSLFMKVLNKWLIPARPCVVVHKRTSLMSSSLLLQHNPLCPVCLVCEMGGKLPYRYSFVECYFQNLFKTAHGILVQFTYNFFLCVSLASGWCLYIVMKISLVSLTIAF